MSSTEVPPYSNCDISSGNCSIIEAAAGTGKTFNMTNIAARIIMERSDVTIDKMVIVTFTRAAAGELKTRISQRLAKLEKDVQNPEPRDELIKIALGKGVLKDDIRKRLRMALLNFDRAMIGTIHSFAMRCLSENGFDSRLKFGFTLNEGSSAIIKELSRDFSRSISYTEDAEKLNQVLQKYAEDMDFFTRNVMSNPDAEVKWPDGIETVTDIDEALKNISAQEELIRKIREKFEPVIAERKAAYAEAEANFKALDARRAELFAKKTASKTKEDTLAWKDSIQLCNGANEEKKAAKKAWEEEERKLKEELAPLEKKAEGYKNGLSRMLNKKSFDHVSEKYRQLCEEKNFLGHDDLIFKMAEALDKNPVLVQKLQKSFPVGLIDEFQDTNDSQFAIFNKIFVENPLSTFIVVGDPRQAIYRFRGCDINTYLNARKLMESQRNARLFQMNTNYRSGQKYIDALNALFKPGSFAMDNMDMPRQESESGSKVLLTSEGEEVPHPIEAAYNEKTDHHIIARWCAADICNLIKAGYRLPAKKDRAERPVEFGDIAVLTYRWGKADEIRKELEKCGVPVRLQKSQNVFKSAQARQLALFLEGILNHNDHNALLRALITPLGDLTLEMLKSEDEITSRARWMQELHNLWYKRSFMVMFNELLIRFRVSDRLASQTGGERDLSNISTIADILGEEAFTGKLTPGAVLRKLQKHIEAAEEEKDSYPARPETDRGTVLINTVFGSKGLSYPVVFLPDLFYMGTSYSKKTIPKFFHENNKLCFAPLMDDGELKIARDEVLQENLRKVYVAMTRANYYCRFYCGTSSSHMAPTDWLFKEHAIDVKSSDLCTQLDKAAKNPLSFPEKIGKVELSGIPPQEHFDSSAPPLFRRPDLLPYLISQSGFLSFTSITPHSSPSSALAGDKYDEGESEEDPQTPPAAQKEKAKLPETFALPSGTAFGNAVHTTLEICDYDISESSLLPIVQRQLNIHGLSGEKHGAVTAKMLHRMLNTPVADNSGGSFKLSEIPAKEKKCEFEFLYEFGQSFHTATLFKTANNYFEEKFNLTCPEFTDENSAFDTGFFNGSIDLFFKANGKFYIVDWKTNKLKTPELYENSKLRYAMANSRYYLQYMIYTAALFKYLKERLLPAGGNEEELYEQYMGGVFYIFVRGFTGKENSGIFSDRLPYSTVKELEEIIG